MLAALVGTLALDVPCASAQAGAWQRPADSPAVAETSADPLLRSADRLAVAGEREGALALLRQLEARAPDGGVSGRMAVLESALGQFRKAESHAQTALRSPDDVWVVAHMSELAAAISESARHLGTLTVDGLPAGTTARVNGEQVGVLPSPLRLLAGAVTVSLQLPDGRTGTLRGTVVAQQSDHVDGSRYVGPSTSRMAASAAGIQTRAGVSGPADAQSASARQTGTDALVVSAESRQAWADFVRAQAPAQRERRQTERWLRSRPSRRIWAGMTMGIGRQPRSFGPHTSYDSSSFTLLGVAGVLYSDLTEWIVLSSTLEAGYFGSRSDSSIRNLYDDPVYSSTNDSRKGHLYYLSLRSMFRLTPGVHEIGSSLHYDAGIDVELLLFRYKKTTSWARSDSARGYVYDTGQPTHGTEASYTVFGSVGLGVYLNRQKTLDIGTIFDGNLNRWKLGIYFSVAITGWMPRPDVVLDDGEDAQ